MRSGPCVNEFEFIHSLISRCQSVVVCPRHLLKLGRTTSNTQFVVPASVAGIDCRVLYDTGASLCFVRAGHPLLDKASRCSESSIPQVSVVLGDGSVARSTDCVRLNFNIAGKSHAWDYHVLNLPQDFDIIVGMDFMAFHDVSLFPANKRVLFGEDCLPIGEQEGLQSLLAAVQAPCSNPNLPGKPNRASISREAEDRPKVADAGRSCHPVESNPDEQSMSHKRTQHEKCVQDEPEPRAWTNDGLYILSDGVEVDFVYDGMEALMNHAAHPTASVNSIWQHYGESRAKHVPKRAGRTAVERKWSQISKNKEEYCCMTAVVKRNAARDAVKPVDAANRAVETLLKMHQ